MPWVRLKGSEQEGAVSDIPGFVKGEYEFIVTIQDKPAADLAHESGKPIDKRIVDSEISVRRVVDGLGRQPVRTFPSFSAFLKFLRSQGNSRVFCKVETLERVPGAPGRGADGLVDRCGGEAK